MVAMAIVATAVILFLVAALLSPEINIDLPGDWSGGGGVGGD